MITGQITPPGERAAQSGGKGQKNHMNRDERKGKRRQQGVTGKSHIAQIGMTPTT
jgi:hypothetical protein